MNGPVTTAQITITRIIDGQGRLAVHVTTPPQFNATELLGMLEMAKSQIFHDLELRRHRDEY